MEKVKKDNPMQLLRARLGRTCRQMAEDTGYSVNSVQNMLKDDGCTENFMRKVCEVYQVDERYFRGEISLDEALENSGYIDRKPDHSAIGERLRDRREELGLSKRKLGEKIGCSHGTIANLENGQGITDKSLAKLASALDVSVEYLKTGKQASFVSDDMIAYLNRNEMLRRVILGMMREDGWNSFD